MENTLRTTARELIVASVTECAEYDHMRNYRKLHVYRDGSINWSECINKSDDIIDSQAEGFQAVQSVACVGTGSIDCNCDYCNEVYNAESEAFAHERGREYDKSTKYDSQAEAIADAVSNSDLSGLEADMLAEFDSIPVGYFNDEPEDA